MGLSTTPTRSSKGPSAQAVKPVHFQYGRSVSGANPVTDLSTSSNNSFRISLNGDTAHTVSIAINSYESTSGAAIAKAIQEAVQGVVSSTPEFFQAYREFTCVFNDQVYILTSGLHGENSSVVVTNAISNNVAADLKLGIDNGGTEDSYYPKDNAYAEYVEIANSEQNPVPVKITDVDVTIDASDLDVHLTHDGPEPDSIQIGDGANVLDINPDGSINVVTSGDTAVSSPVIANVACALANTEYSYTLPLNTTRFCIKARGISRIQLAYTAGQTSSEFFTIFRGCSFLETSLKGDPAVTIYFQADKANEIIEILSWS